MGKQVPIFIALGVAASGVVQYVIAHYANKLSFS
jgi:hypothetical protein